MTPLAAAPTASFDNGPLAPRPTRSSVGMLIVAPIATFAVLLPLGMLIVLGPKFEEIFRDFGASLSMPTRFFLNLARDLASPPGLAALMVLAMVVYVAVAAAWRFRREVGAMLLVLCILWAIGMIGAMLAAFWTPLVALVESLQQGA